MASPGRQQATNYWRLIARPPPTWPLDAVSVVRASKAGWTCRLHWTPCKPPLDQMTSGHPIIIQIKTLLNEANQVAAVRTLLSQGLRASDENGSARTGRPCNGRAGCKHRRRHNHPQGEVN